MIYPLDMMGTPDGTTGLIPAGNIDVLITSLMQSKKLDLISNLYFKVKLKKD
jgi:hypothetical protein